MWTDKFEVMKSDDKTVIPNVFRGLNPGSNSGEFSLHNGVKIVALLPIQRNPCQSLDSRLIGNS